MDLQVSRQDAGRLLSMTTERRKRAERGLKKFGDDFDPVLGANIAASAEAYTKLEQVLKEAINAQDNHPRGAGRDPA
jgi:hypothetical protein